jgi:hypothetical protein
MSNDIDWVVFIDALTDDDIPDGSLLDETRQGTLDAGVPRVTPRVTGSFWTGDDPAINGMPSLSRFNQENRMRPATPTVMEQLSQQTERNVLSYQLPFTMGLNMGPGSAFLGTGLGGQMSGFPQELLGSMQIPGPAGDLIGEDPDVVYNLMVDYTRQTFATARQLANTHGFDTVFIGYRLIDSYCHFQYEHPLDEPKRYRDRLAELVSHELEDLDRSGNVMWFSDHGATRLETTFRINHWLKEQGYLDYEIDQDFADKFEAVQQQQGGNRQGAKFPNDKRVENQVSVGSPSVKLDPSSAVVCGDPFDCGLTILNEDALDREQLKKDLMDTGHFRDVYDRGDLFDPNGPCFEECPDILPDRKEGVFVSGNLHPDAVGMGYYRTGVHLREGVFGGTHEFDRDIAIPEEMYDMICAFLGFEPVDPQQQQLEQMGRQQKLELKRKLEKEVRA